MTLRRTIVWTALLSAILYSAGALGQSQDVTTTSSATGLMIPFGTNAVTWPAAAVIIAWKAASVLEKWAASIREVASAIRAWTPALTLRVEDCRRAAMTDEPTGSHRLPPAPPQ